MTVFSAESIATGVNAQDWVDEFNRTDHDFPSHLTLQELFEAQAARSAAVTAIICDHDRTFNTPTLTYAALNARVNQLAHRLRASGVGSGSIVGLLVERFPGEYGFG